MSRGNKGNTAPSPEKGKQDVQKVRVDKWLWAARFFKTRSLATDCVESGKVRCNDERIKPAYGVQVGDVIKLPVGWDEIVVQVTGLADKRGSAAIAQTLYQETEESRQERKRRAENRKLMKDPSLEIKARPTKRDRRAMDNFRWGEAE
ncbi:RNA-binding S4 domain-containing protein [Limnobacter sp.]|uniref:RNA-binding S4 domain-containing protein n=1 Tax=Limnobacter sp. TaxID=2003368 RepID=UPI00258595F0|nr:RNA-binding S4 domain-containing protein [Limnobacter sp.]